ncbi:ABC transporter permease subunit [Dermatophilus congolensis]|nr:ABC transporter permease subunit [Dermatophilus congolensis]MBO3132318.1 ABC transporter permease subunit [Dermatophilus congolensis]MBO3133521.1 ABC transporter permease subunit [Dermatophilus congolensis]MBO3137994.1 ABC transporter permease subunit [Dermatophilus congolensis]MBO3140235.1 ABC transporter permease subunit [Dermatophilus congolensis]
MVMISVELMKWRGRHILLISGLLTLALLAWAGMVIVKLQRAPSTPAAGKVAASTVQTGTQLMSLLLPVMVAIIASRIVSIEHDDRMLQMLRSLGCSSWQSAVSKTMLTWGLVSGFLGIYWVLVCLIGSVFDAGPALVQLLSVLSCLVIAAAALSAVHLGLGMAFENQWVTLGAGIIGGLFGSASLLMPPVVAALTPWTLIGGASPVRLTMIDGHAQYVHVSSVVPLLIGLAGVPLWWGVSAALVVWKAEEQ